MDTELVLVPDDGAPPIRLPSPIVHTATAELVAAWLAGRLPSTVAAYRKDIRDFSHFLNDDYCESLDAFLASDGGSANRVVLAYRNVQLERGLAAATICRRLAAIRSLVKLARTLGRVTWSIEVDPPRAEKRRDMRGPDEGQLKKLVKAAKADGDGPRAKRDRAMLALMAGMGLRRNEVAGLDQTDVDFPRGLVLVCGKGRREKQSLELPPEVSRSLAEWSAVRGGHPGPLFHDVRTERAGHRGRLSGETIRRAVGRLATAAKLGVTVRPHGLRHSLATRLLSGGETIVDVMAVMRHEKPETTMRYHDELHQSAGRLTKKASKVLG